MWGDPTGLGVVFRRIPVIKVRLTSDCRLDELGSSHKRMANNHLTAVCDHLSVLVQ